MRNKQAVAAAQPGAAPPRPTLPTRLDLPPASGGDRRTGTSTAERHERTGQRKTNRNASHCCVEELLALDRGDAPARLCAYRLCGGGEALRRLFAAMRCTLGPCARAVWQDCVFRSDSSHRLSHKRGASSGPAQGHTVTADRGFYDDKMVSIRCTHPCVLASRHFRLCLRWINTKRAQTELIEIDSCPFFIHANFDHHTSRDASN